MNPSNAPRIVVLGAGFGGTYVARRLRRAAKRGIANVMVVDRANHFLFTPLLHEVATGGLTAASVAEPLREAFVNTPIDVVSGEVELVDRAAKTVNVSGRTIPYDYLVIATGASTNTYGVDGVEKYSVGLKDLRDAITIKNRIIDAFNIADGMTDTVAQAKALHFVVVGAGATGVELVAEIAEFAETLHRRYHDCGSGSPLPAPRVTLVSAGPELLAQFPVASRAKALARLRKLGIDVKLGMNVTAVDRNGIAFGDGTRIDATMVIWAAGVRASSPAFLGEVPLCPSGRLLVTNTLQLKGDDSVFVVGDVAECVLPDAPKGQPMLAQVAVQQAGIVAHNLLAMIENTRLEPFRYSSKGGLVSLGKGYAVGDVFGFTISGFFAWWLWRTIYISKFGSWKKRIRIGFEWFLELFYARDITRVR